MRHQKNTVKLGRTAEHRKALLANQVCSLIEHSRIKTTLAKAKAVRPFAERMLTLGKRGTLHDRRNAIAYLHNTGMVKKLFEEIAPRSSGRNGGYTRIIKLGPRMSDSAPMAYIEWVDAAPSADELAPKQVGAPADKKADKPAAGEAVAKTPPEKKTGDGTVKKRATGSQRTAAIAKRAATKTRKVNASPTPQAKARGKSGAKGRTGGRKK